MASILSRLCISRRILICGLLWMQTVVKKERQSWHFLSLLEKEATNYTETEKKCLVRKCGQIPVVSNLDATVYWVPECWHNTGLWFDQLQIRLFLYPVLTPLPPPPTLKKKKKTHHTVSLAVCHSFPWIFKNCSHMFEGTQGSNAHLEKQHYYLQLTFEFGEGALVQGEKRWWECGRRDRDLKKNRWGQEGGISWSEVCMIVLVRVCAPAPASTFVSLQSFKSQGRLIAFQR